MARSEGSAQNSALDESEANTVLFYPKLAASAAFKSLFREGMSLVEDTAAYLDGPGREEQRVWRVVRVNRIEPVTNQDVGAYQKASGGEVKIFNGITQEGFDPQKQRARWPPDRRVQPWAPPSTG